MSKNTLYTATWCAPCKVLKKRLDDDGYTDLIDIVVIDDCVQELKSSIGLRTIPALMTKDGLVVDTDANQNAIYNIISGDK